MTVTDPYTLVKTYMAAAATAIEADDYATAIREARKAWAWAIPLADMKRDPSGGGAQEITWHRESIEQFINGLLRQRNAGVGVQVVDNTYYGEAGRT